MSKDPFEELFGALNDDSGADEGAAEVDARTAPLPKQDMPKPADVRPAARVSPAAPTEPMPAARPAAAQPVAATEPMIVRRSNAQPIPGGQPFTASQQPATPAAVAPSAPRASHPMPARQRLAHEQAERVMTSQKPAGGQSKLNKSLPWIIVAAVAVIAIVIAIVLVNGASKKPEPEAKPDTSSSQAASDGSEAVTPPVTEEPEEVVPEEDPEEVAPQVEVGSTSTLAVTQWDVTSEISDRLGFPVYSLIDGDKSLALDSDLLSSFPAECGYADGVWGATKLDNGSYEVRKPEACAAASGLYSEVWGLVAAWVETIK